ncbi:hypothetical protein IAU59_000540 [Kwoniella sp. CBS 9459]
MRALSVISEHDDDDEDEIVLVKYAKCSEPGPSRIAYGAGVIGGSSGNPLRSQTAPSSNKKVVWLPERAPLHSPEVISINVNGEEKLCTKKYRTGWTHGGIRYLVDDAIRLSSPPFDVVLIRSIHTLKFLDPNIPSKSYAHVHYLDRPTHKDIGASGSTRRGELFLKHMNCQDIALKMVVEGAKLDFEIVKGSRGRQSDTKYFAQFVSEPTASTIRTPSSAVEFQGCDSCESRHRRASQDSIVLKRRALRIGDQLFHQLDFVLIDPQIQGSPYIVGHLVGWKKEGQWDIVEVRILKRKAELMGSKPGEFVSERQLVATDVHECYPARRIMGHAFVLGNEEACLHDIPGTKTAFWCAERLTLDNDRKEITVPLKRSLQSCSTCLEQERLYRHDLKSCIDVAQFPAADCYSGAGGFLLPGLDIFDWRSACDTDLSACQTLFQLKEKAPALKIHHRSVEALLHRAFDRTLGNRTNQARFPARGSTFMLTGGPPCQGHSRASHANNSSEIPAVRTGPRDERNGEMFVFLTLVAQVRPYVVVLENVGAFKDDKEESSQENADGNFARRATREFTSMGYATRLAIINSRAYGSPQDRHRCFILAVRGDLPLPDFPTPSHAVPSPMATVFKDEKGQTMPFYLGPRKGTRGTGAHPPITIDDAISDLPAFDYHSPLARRPAGQQPRRPIFSGSRDPAKGNDTKCGFALPVPYACAALNDFQRSKRGSGKLVQDHYTSYCTPGALEIIFNRSNMAEARGCERRAIKSEGFSTLLTNSAPGGKSTAVIHPSQDRKFTTAERKRAMGWPDWFKLAGTPLDQDRLTGNGFCFESVEAIYHSIVEIIILPWWIKAGRPREKVFERFISDHPIA